MYWTMDIIVTILFYYEQITVIEYVCHCAAWIGISLTLKSIYIFNVMGVYHQHIGFIESTFEMWIYFA